MGKIKTDLNEIRITPDDFPPLKEPLAFDVEYDEEFKYFHAYNKTLELHAFGDTEEELKRNAVEEFAFFIGLSISTPDEEMTSGLKKAVDYVKSIVDFDKIDPDEYKLEFEDPATV